MKTWMIATGVAVMAATGAAMAQQAPASPPPPPPPGMDAGPHHPGRDGGPEGGPRWRHMHEMMQHMQPTSKAAHFRLRKGDAMVDIKCADDEPMKACVDASSALLDKLAAQTK